MTAAAQKTIRKRRKKKRLCESMSMARFKVGLLIFWVYLTNDLLAVKKVLLCSFTWTAQKKD